MNVNGPETDNFQRMRVLAFLNAYSEGMSGGDACFIELLKRQQVDCLTIIASRMGRDVCVKRGMKPSFHAYVA
jgi:hypothetical protein